MMVKLFKLLARARPQRVLEGDKGKNTGGIGAYSPSRLISKELRIKLSKIVNNT